MFDNLDGRRVFVSTTFEEGFRGTIEHVGELHIRIRDFEVAGPNGLGGIAFTPAEGVARIPRSAVTWIQEL